MEVEELRTLLPFIYLLLATLYTSWLRCKCLFQANRITTENHGDDTVYTNSVHCATLVYFRCFYIIFSEIITK